MASTRGLVVALLATVCVCISAPATAVAGSFGLKELEVRPLADELGSPATQAGSHPFAVQMNMAVETEEVGGKVVPVEEARNLTISFPPGLVGNPTAVPQCPAAQFLAGKHGECADAAAVGVARIEFGELGKWVNVPVYNLVPSPGVTAKLGFIVEDRAPVTIDIGVNPDSPNNVIARATNISQALAFLSAKVVIWGVPASAAHDSDRGNCALELGTCPISLPEKPFLTLPVSCAPLGFGFEAKSWKSSTPPFATSVTAVGPASEPLSSTGCAQLEFTPDVSAQPTTSAASSGSGLEFGIDVDDAGLESPNVPAEATIEKAVVTLPEGMTLNPSIASGLATCSEADLGRETAFSAPGEGCPQASKVGVVEVETPLLEGKLLKGALYVASQNENPFHSLIALYMVIKDSELGILIKLPGRVTPDPETGQLVTTFGEAPYRIPQVPFSHFRFRFRAGERAPLITPPTCGSHTVTVVLTPSSGNAARTVTSKFPITSGPGGSPCSSGATPAFAPGFEAGSLNNTAGAFSPFYLRLTRRDGEQDMTRFSSILPPGVTGKIAGLERCPQGAVEAAKTKSGRAELAVPSCPAGSRIGSTMSGAGVGNSLTWVPGSLYLGGPYHGAPLSVVAVVPAVAGPFDVGTVVVQEALNLNPLTAEVEVDGAASDPIPHILAGIPLNLRDLQIYVDRPEFTLNATSCEAGQVRATLFGSNVNLLNPSDDLPVALSTRYQAANCASLAFKPTLQLKLRGQMRISGHPALTAVLRPRAGDANVGATTVLLPHSQFIDQFHISNPCTRVQYNEGAGKGANCPRSSIIGTAAAYTPLLDEPLRGNVYFRSNGGARELPDVVLSLDGLFHIEQVGFVDSRHERIRTRFAAVPDAPISKVVIKFFGGKRGLLENSANLCAHKQRARVSMAGQNGRRAARNQVIRTTCKKK